uniref:Uncharacterized protein n=1 Tax=Rhizophora mucronata TaxID=61149 RepID=A0A2P2N7M1_RHIMU
MLQIQVRYAAPRLRSAALLTSLKEK